MENKDLIAIYVTILMGALTAATVVVTLLKEELLGKSFQEIIKKLGENAKDKNQKNPVKKDIKLIMYNMILFAVILIFVVLNSILNSISNTKFSGEIGILNGFLEFSLICLIIIFVIFIARIYIYLYLIYSEIIEIKKGKNIFSKESQSEVKKLMNFRKVFGIQKYIKYNNEKWEKLLGELVIESTDPAHYELISVIIENNFEYNFLKDIVEKTKIENLNNISLDDYLCRKRNIVISNYLNLNRDRHEKLTSIDCKVLGYYKITNRNISIGINEVEGEIEEYVSGFIERMLFLLRNKKSHYEVEQSIRDMIEEIEGIQESKESKESNNKILAKQKLLKNLLKYPLICENPELKRVIEFLKADKKSNIQKCFKGYSNVKDVKEKSLIEKFNSISFYNWQEYDSYFDGVESAYEYLYQIGEPRNNILLEPYADKLISSFKSASGQGTKKEILKIIENRIKIFNSEQKKELKSIVASNTSNNELKRNYPKLYKWLYEMEDVLKLILSHFADDVNEINVNDKVNEIMESDHRIIKIKNPIDNEIGGILSAKVTSGNNPKGIRFFYEVIQPNKKPEDFDHIYFAGNDIGEVFNKGIFRYDKTEENYRIKMNLKEIKDDFSTIVATEILKNSESEETFIKELKSKLKKIADEYKDKKGNTPEN